MVRLFLILAVATLVIGVTWLAVTHLPGLSHETLQRGFMGFRAYRRRPLEPRPGAFGQILVQLALVVGGGFTARKLLRIHL